MTLAESQRQCGQCGKVYPRTHQSGKRWAASRFCSLACSGASRIIAEPQQFWARVNICGPDECWPWNGAASRTKGRYGEAVFEGEVRQAHRVAFRLTHGFWPPYTRHSCDFGLCCNPAHLLEGTHDDNMRDKVARGRQARGETCRQSSLTAADVIAIRADPRNHLQVSADYGVDPSNICRIRGRKTWKHL